MKTILTVALLCLSFLSIAGEKVTLIERIESADSIPVYFELGAVSVPNYIAPSSQPQLNSKEASQTRKYANTPHDVDSIADQIITSLNTAYNTDKFYFVASDDKEAVRKMINDAGHEFFVLTKFRTSYGYNMQKQHSRNANRDLVLNMRGEINGFIQFMIPGKKADKFNQVGQISHMATEQFVKTGFTMDANELLKAKPVATIVPKFISTIDARIQEKKTKHYEKHEKAKNKK